MAGHRVGVFCGSRGGARAGYAEAAAALGEALARRGIGIVYGGGRVGLMGVLADAALAAGGEVVGVIPRSLSRREVMHPDVGDMRVVPGLAERKAQMIALADAFVTLPGGFGTLDELFEVLTWRQLGLADKPCLLLNVGGYFDDLLGAIDRIVGEGFAAPEHRRLLAACEGVDAAMAWLDGALGGR